MDWRCEWRHARKLWAGILSDLEYKQWVEIWTLTKRVDFSDLGEASEFVDCGVRTRVGWVNELKADDGRTVSTEKLFLSPRVENLNLKKVIKVSYLYQKGRQCFVFFGFLWTYEHSMNIYTFHISVYFGIPYVYFTCSYLGLILVNMLQQYYNGALTCYALLYTVRLGFCV